MPDHHNDHVTIIVPARLAEALVRALEAASARSDESRSDEILAKLEGLETMSQNLSGQLDDISAREEAARGRFSDDLQKIADAIRNNTPAAGATITQAQVDRQKAIADSLDTLVTTADSLVASLGSGSVSAGGAGAGGDTTGGAGSTVSGSAGGDTTGGAGAGAGAGGDTIGGAAAGGGVTASPAFDATDQTPNAPGGRNSPMLSGFDQAQPPTS
jgi:hypothetical protein